MRFTFLLSIFLFFTISLHAQDQPVDTTKNARQVVVTKHNGVEYIGVILSDDGREVLIDSKSLGKIYIPKSDIRSITPIDDPKSIVNNEYQSEGPFTTRYAFTNNALPIVKGENYAMVNLYGPEVHFAVSNNLNIGVMKTSNNFSNLNLLISRPSPISCNYGPVYKT